MTTFKKAPEKKQGFVESIKRSFLNSPALKASKLKKDAEIKERIYDIGYKYAAILMRFNDLDPSRIASMSDEDVTIQHKAAFKSFMKGGKSIEIIKDDCIQRVHFRIKNRVSVFPMREK